MNPAKAPSTKATIPAHGKRTGAPEPVCGQSGVMLHNPDKRDTADAATELALAHALELSDEEAIWHRYRQATDKDRFMSGLARLAGQYSTEYKKGTPRSTRWHHALFAVPFLLPSQRWPVPLPDKADHKTPTAVCAQIQAWLGYHQPVRVLGEAVRYEDLCNWSPLLQREYLKALEWRKSSCSRPAVRFAASLPDDWPRLAFVVGGVHRCNCAPQWTNPAPSARTESDLRTRLAAHLAYIHQRPVNSQHVLAPLFFSEAVLNGLQLWLGELCQLRLVSGWDVQLHRPDYLTLTLTQSGGQQGKAILPIRLHQLGCEGSRKLLNALEAAAGHPTHSTLPF